MPAARPSLARSLLATCVALLNGGVLLAGAITTLVITSNQEIEEGLDDFRRRQIIRACGPVVAQHGPTRERIETRPDGLRVQVYEADRLDGGTASVTVRAEFTLSENRVDKDCGP